ncbi:MAG: hypothetical protein ACF8MF_06845 [Phycisphaerales bacterium JB052]
MYKQTVLSVERDVRDALSSIETGQDGRFQSGAGIVSRIRLDILRSAQVVEEVWQRWEARLDQVEGVLNEYHRVIGGRRTVEDVDRTIIQALRGQWPKAGQPGTGLAGQFYDLTDHHRKELANALTRNVLGHATRDSLVKDLSKVMDRSSNQVQQLVHDTTMEYSRTVNAEKSTGYQYFRYSGPADSVTRPFCSKLVNKVFTRQQIEKMDNGQSGNAADVFIAAGGYNCRHHWRPVKREWYEEDEWARLIG